MFNPAYYSATFIDDFLGDLRACNHNVFDWSSRHGVYIDWEKERRLMADHAARKATKHSAGSTAGHEQRRR